MTKLAVILNIKNKYIFSLFIRCLSVLFVCIYIAFLYDTAFDWYAYTLRYFLLAFCEFFIYGIGCNFGLFFITTKKAKKMKIWSTIFYIPTFLLTPFVVGALSPYYSGIFIVFLSAIFVYYYFNPWRSYD